jgi:hypothetical protein
MDSAVRRPMHRISELAHLGSNQTLEPTAGRRDELAHNTFTKSARVKIIAALI